jgi:predicted protein tyrosine phosphatase
LNMLIVTSLREAQVQFASQNVGRVIGILSPEMPHPVFSSLDPTNHLRLSFHDVASHQTGLAAPTLRDAERLINFISDWDQSSPMLIHCWAGISRSTAAAFTALCLLRPDEDEQDLSQELRHASPSATPNRMIVSQVDAILGRKGRMIKAVENIGRGADAFDGAAFVLRTLKDQPPE